MQAELKSTTNAERCCVDAVGYGLDGTRQK